MPGTTIINLPFIRERKCRIRDSQFARADSPLDLGLIPKDDDRTLEQSWVSAVEKESCGCCGACLCFPGPALMDEYPESTVGALRSVLQGSLLWCQNPTQRSSALTSQLGGLFGEAAALICTF